MAEAMAAAEVENEAWSPVSIGRSPIRSVVTRPAVDKVARIAIGRTRRICPAATGPPLQRILRIVLLGYGAEGRLPLGC